MRPVQPERIFDSSDPGGQTAIVTAKQFTEGGCADQALKGIRTAVNRIPMTFFEVRRQVAADFAVMSENPHSKFRIFALLSMARPIVRSLVQERRKLLEALAKSDELALALGDGQGGY